MFQSDRPDLRSGWWDLLDRYPMTFGVLAANLLLFLFAGYKSGGWPVDIDMQLALGTNEYSRTLREPWRLLTHGFLHFDPIHFALNSLALFILGRILEVHFGSSRLWVVYAVSVIAGGVVSALWYGLVAGPAVSAGASGGIFGLILLGFLYARSVPERLGTLADHLQYWIVAGVVISLVIPGIDMASHAGGAAAGAVAGLLVKPEPGKDPHPSWTPAALVLCLLCLASFALVIWRFRQLT